MPRLTKDLNFEYKDKSYTLYSRYLYLHTDYADIYDMKYITPLLVKDKILLIHTINTHFATSNMIKYYGSMMNLNCNETRLMYKNMNNYFLNLFLKCATENLNIDINQVDDNNDNICLIAECLNIIRSGIKKYSRLRTATNQILCTKESLNDRNSKTYDCELPIGNYEQCPTFEYLRVKRGKSCKNIVTSSKKTNPIFSFLAKRLKYRGRNNKTRNHSVKPTKYSLTRKVKSLKHVNTLNLLGELTNVTNAI
jgi:hypothetical protein